MRGQCRPIRRPEADTFRAHIKVAWARSRWAYADDPGKAFVGFSLM